MPSKTQLLLLPALCGLLCLAPQPAEGQKDYPTVNYEFGKVIEGLPYGRKFYISGPLKEFNRLKAEVVILDIYELGPSPKKEVEEEETEPRSYQISDEAHFYNGYYWDDPEAQGPNGKFRILVNKPLKLEQQYQLHFRYYNTYEIRGGEDIVLRFQSILDSIFAAKAAIDVDDVSFALDELNRKLASQYKFGKLGFDMNGNFTVVANEFQPITFPINTKKGLIEKRNLMELARTKYNLQTARRKFREKQQELQSISRSTAYRVLANELESLLSKKLAGTAPDINIQYNAQDIEALQDFAETLELQASSPFANFKSLYTQGVLPETAFNTLIKLDQGYSTLRQNQDIIDREGQEIRRLEEQFGSIEQIIIRGFQLTGNARVIDRATVVSKTELQNLKVGTAVGGSLAALNAGNNNSGASQVDPFSYAGLKLFFKPVDKGLPDPYIARPSPWNRMAFLLGVQLGNDLNYRGQNLDDLLGIKPVLGFSYDANPFIGIEVGSVFFEQSSISPVLSEQRPRIAPFISISLDPDLLNRFQSLLTEDKYRITSD